MGLSLEGKDVRPLSLMVLMLFARLGAVQPGGLQSLSSSEAFGAGEPFLATEILGRPTDSSVTINAVAAIDLAVAAAGNALQ